jgi:DNA polymerase sigma
LHEKYVTFSDNGNKEIINENKKIYENLKKNRISEENSDNLGDLTVNLINENRTINEEEIIIDKKKDELIEENINNNKEIKIRINSMGKQDKSNILSRSEKKITNNNESTEKNIINSNININNIKDKIKSNSNSSNKNNKNTKKKREKSPNIFFLFDTMKNKNKRKPKSKSPNNIKTEKNNNLELSFIPSNNKSSIIYKDYHLYFLEKLHNNILNNDKKVDNILQPLIKIKNYCVEEIKTIIKSTYDSHIKDYTINLYGSFITGLMIETSDIDIRIKINECNNNDFKQYFISLSNKLKEVNKFENITPISTASVPVIKLLINIEKFIQGTKDLEEDFINFKQLNIYKNYLFDKKELLQMKIDITFILNDNQKNNNELGINNKIDKLLINMNSNNELSSVLFIKKQLEEYPEIKPILRLLKRYFYTKKMNSSFEGGLSSYNLFLLILSFAKYQKYFNINQNQLINLGAFLIQFLEFFGKNFDFKNYLININSPIIYESINSNIYQSGKSLIILDPLTGINASKSSYKIDEIQNMFLNAFDYFERESNIYENGFIKEPYSKHDNKNENILGLTKNSKKNKKDKICANIIDKFFFS